MSVTMQDIAERVKVSKATVSRVLSKREDPFISEATRDRVMATAQEMGYRPNRLARALATGKTHMITLWTPDLHSSFYVRVIQHTENRLIEHGYAMISRSARNDVEWPGWPVDGMLALDLAHWLKPFMKENRLMDVPVVNMGVIDRQDTDVVGIDLYPAAKEAVYHLVMSGRKRIVYIFTPGTDFAGDPRRKAFSEVTQGAGLEELRLLLADGTRSTARRTFVEYVQANGCPDGVFCEDDDIAIGVYRALCDLGIRVPDDVALVGCDGIEDGEYLETPLSTIVMPVEEMCALAWQFLHRRILDPSTQLQHVMLRPKLVIRESSRG